MFPSGLFWIALTDLDFKHRQKSTLREVLSVLFFIKHKFCFVQSSIGYTRVASILARTFIFKLVKVRQSEKNTILYLKWAVSFECIL